jgi:succinate dehydrogenase/fumarate reductase cytochrome b subunit
MTPEMVACLSDTTRLVSALQSISGVVLLFLLGLTIRNRFRMK